MLKHQLWAKSLKRRKVAIKNRNKKTMRFQPGTRSFCVRPGDRDLQIFDMEGPQLRNTSLNGINIINCTSITDRHTASVTETPKTFTNSANNILISRREANGSRPSQVLKLFGQGTQPCEEAMCSQP